MPVNRGKKRAIGLGGIFFKAKDPKKLSAWYEEHLGIEVKDQTATFTWKTAGRSKQQRVGHTVWSIFPADTKYFSDQAGESKNGEFMINYRVRDLRTLLKQLRKEGVKVDTKVEEFQYGKFAWITDPEGNRVELWEPPSSPKFPEKSIPME